jgi:hypothetical protein
MWRPPVESSSHGPTRFQSPADSWVGRNSTASSSFQRGFIERIATTGIT